MKCFLICSSSKFSRKGESKRTEILDDDGCDLLYFCESELPDCLNKKLQDKGKIITEMFGSIKDFNVRLSVWVSQMWVP